MAQTNQNVTISLTLPISCQICLGKVRQPVICSNHHVFCSVCLEVWLSKASQCPTCRVPITPDNPYKEIIGATNDGDAPQSPTLKRRIRKTRGELLLKEYEDEIESLLRENEELRNKNRAAETQPETLPEPGAAVSVSRAEGRDLDPGELQEWATKLRAATDLYEKVKQDVEKLKEANKTLRAQNVDLVQENMRLKAEVENRSPRKYGRYTVAALEAKIQQHERDVAHLKRALERSDQYIEDLEAQRDRLAEESARASEGTCGLREGAAGRPVGDRITAMRRSLSEIEEPCVSTNLDGMLSGFRGDQSLLLTTSEKLFENAATPHKPSGGDTGGGGDVRSSFASPTTPSSAIRSLSLRSPLVQSEGRAGRGCGQRGRGPLSYLRRLSFDGCSTTSATPTPSEQNPAASKNDLRESPWRTAQSFRGPSTTAESSDVTRCGPDTEASACSEAYMDAAYREKMSELDLLISDGEGPSATSSGFSASRPASGTGSEPGTSDRRTDTPGMEATSRPGVDGGKDTGDRRMERAEVTLVTSAGMGSSSSTSSSSSSSSSSAPSSSVMPAQVGQVTKRGCPSGPMTCSPSKLSRRI